jgi:hypothetical protein
MKKYWSVVVKFLLDFKKEPSWYPNLPPDNPEPTTRSLEHLMRANRALAMLKSKGYHFTYLSKAAPYWKNPDKDDDFELEYAKQASIRFAETYVVSVRSDFLIDGSAFFEKLDEVGSDEDRFVWVQIRTYTILGSAYGGLHLAAWASLFPSAVELWMWRGSALAMAAAPFLFLIYTISTKVEKWIWPPYSEAGYRGWQRLRYVVAYTFEHTVVYVILWLTALCWVVYPIARLYVLVESFASLRAVSKKTYTTVEWTNFIPHVG